MADILDTQERLQQEAGALLEKTALLKMLQTLGDVTQTGSSVTGLMVYPDIDFAIQNDASQFEDALKLIPSIIADLKATALKVADFKTDEDPFKGYYIGFEIPFQGKTWHIDATIGHTGPIITNPPELASWLENMSEDERVTILTLKRELIDAKRYVGSKSQPPYTFRSSHLYEGVLKGGAKTVTDLEAYFRQ